MTDKALQFPKTTLVAAWSVFGYQIQFPFNKYLTSAYCMFDVEGYSGEQDTYCSCLSGDYEPEAKTDVRD